MNKGIIDLIPAAVEAVKQESMKKMKLFGSERKAANTCYNEKMDVDRLVQVVVEEVNRRLVRKL